MLRFVLDVFRTVYCLPGLASGAPRRNVILLILYLLVGLALVDWLIQFV